MKTEVVQRQACRIIALRHVGPYPEIGPCFGALMEFANRHGVSVLGCLGMFHDDPSTTPPGELRSDACIVVPENYELNQTDGLDLRMDWIPAGEYASATHMGPYEGLSDAWAAFDEEGVPSLGRQTGAICLEVYVNDCSQVPPEEVRTDLLCLLV